QIVQYLRAIASNAAGYVFSLALSSACEKCAQWIDSFEKKIQALNKNMLDSCTAAQKLVNTAKDNPQVSAMIDHMNIGMRSIADGAATISGNLWESMFPSDSGAPTDQTESLKDTAKAALTGSVVWDVIRKQDLKAWFSNDTQEMANVL